MKLSTRTLALGALIAIAAGTASTATTAPAAPAATEAPATSATDLNDTTSSRHTLHFAGTGEHTLEVRAVTGRITIEGYDGTDVEVLVDRSIEADSQYDREAADRDVKLQTSDNADRVRLMVRYQDQPTCGEQDDRRQHWNHHRYDVRYDFTIRVPKNTRLELCTINDGNIVVSGTRGDFTIHTVNGRITLDDVSGSGEARTVNGRLTATFATAPRKASIFKTINGDVVLELPERLAADLRMKTFNGGLYTDFEVEPLEQPMNVSMRRENGKYVYRTAGFTSVRAGGGGPELTLETMNGDVRVLRRSH
jgi:DUF4097 and DUF4098 domain-containing protein YvlB